MNNFINQSNKLLSFALIVLLLQGCGPQTRQSSLSSASNQQNLEYLLKQAQKADPDRKSALLVQASGLLVLERRFEKSQELLIRVNQQLLTPDQMDDFHLYYGETLLGLEANEASLNQLKTIVSPTAKPIHWQLRYAQSLSDSYLANGNYFEAAKLRIELDDLIDDAEVLRANNEKIWQALSEIETDFLQQLITDFNSQRMNGWLEIVYINKRWGYHPQKLLSEIDTWKKRYPLHPSQVNQPATLQKAVAAEEYKPQRIAVLLPLSGKNASIGMMIQDGIIAAHYQSDSANVAPKLSFYDTARSLSALTPYQQAIDDGADFVLGPLTKESLETVLNQESLPVPMLALNRMEEQRYNHPQVFQFGLPVEDEAIQSAHRAFEKGYRKAIAFLPDNTVGKRAEETFREYFEQMGGELVEVQKYKDAKSLKTEVQHLLGVDSSMRRKKSLQQLLGRNLEFEMRRRQDADFIFMIASPAMGRMIKPFINFYYAHDLPVIATSMVYSGKKKPQTDIDLNGIEFPDIPLLLSELPDFEQTRTVLKETQPQALDARGRFFALGFDSYRILNQLAILKAFPEYRWNGLAGELAVDELGLVHRFLTWAQFNRGIPNVTKEREIKQLETQANIEQDKLEPQSSNIN
ncbi:penicillin-binding protein activator [Aliikangiella coralliicola]|uniref:ABC transporter substrate-binding protein n=1 Tax=Aliikangiella coralliicola TaxID=2592383 RepID=A0A545UK29_9GAMM|nr:penicillin-binding protein activator [Aliikangiella coralliicola]TQV89818.1 ABC transporter substrate-binding protein [Aliikangiella coralliicola]